MNKGGELLMGAHGSMFIYDFLKQVIWTIYLIKILEKDA